MPGDEREIFSVFRKFDEKGRERDLERARRMFDTY